MSVELLVLGAGFAGSVVARRGLAQGKRVLTTVRSEARAEALRAEGIDVLVAPRLDAGITAHIDAGTHVVIAFPPDGSSDAELVPRLAAARAVTYISSTGVYGERTGVVDDTTPVDGAESLRALNERAARMLAAEAQYRAVGATVLRCPGIYGPSRGLHVRILRGEHRIPGDGSRTLSRIHVEDLASFVLAAAQVRGETYVVGDLEPARHIDVVRFVCASYGVALPPSVPWESVHESLRADRSVDASRALRELQVCLRYPSYRQGMLGAVY